MAAEIVYHLLIKILPGLLRSKISKICEEINFGNLYTNISSNIGRFDVFDVLLINY